MTLKEILDLELVDWSKEDLEKYVNQEKYENIYPFLISEDIEYLVKSDKDKIIHEILVFAFHLIRESQNEILEFFFEMELGPEECGVDVNDNYEEYASTYGEVGQMYYGLIHRGHKLSWDIALPFYEWSEPEISLIDNG